MAILNLMPWPIKLEDICVVVAMLSGIALLILGNSSFIKKKWAWFAQWLVIDNTLITNSLVKNQVIPATSNQPAALEEVTSSEPAELDRIASNECSKAVGMHVTASLTRIFSPNLILPAKKYLSFGFHKNSTPHTVATPHSSDPPPSSLKSWSMASQLPFQSRPSAKSDTI
ncbi:hypothetical protein V6N11_054338 [Hibiscus sabdariffa]|uniref:Uncharacterized protein n=1 Tax=Hibiscus sabdariffa TaxID=183260 RepID=A0ABR2S3K5_9ROSI